MLTGTEAVLEAALIAAIQAGVLARCGLTPLTPNCIDGLSRGIADAIIPHLVTNTVVLPTSLLDSSSGSVTGTGTIT